MVLFQMETRGYSGNQKAQIFYPDATSARL